METPRKDRADCGSLAMLTIELHSNISTGVVRQIRRNIARFRRPVPFPIDLESHVHRITNIDFDQISLAGLAITIPSNGRRREAAEHCGRSRFIPPEDALDVAATN